MRVMCSIFSTQIKSLFSRPQILPGAAFAVALCISAGPLEAKEVLLSGLSVNGTDWSLFDVSKNYLKPDWETLPEDDQMCSFATSANMLAYQQWRNPSGFPAKMPKGSQEIYNDMQKIYGNTVSSPDVILGAYTNNEIACYPEKYYGESRNYAVSPALSSYTSGIPYFDGNGTSSGLYTHMTLNDILNWAFTHNAPMGLNLQPLYEQGTTPHEITCWGVKYDDFNNIAGLFYTDSDDSVNTDQNTELVALRLTNGFHYQNGKWCVELDANLTYYLFNITMLNPEAFVIPEPSLFGGIFTFTALVITSTRRRYRQKNHKPAH